MCFSLAKPVPLGKETHDQALNTSISQWLLICWMKFVLVLCLHLCQAYRLLCVPVSQTCWNLSNLPVSALMWKKVSLALSSLAASLSPLSCVQEDSDNAHMVVSSLHIFPLQSDEFWRTECLCLTHSLPLSHADPLSTVVFLIPVDRKLFFAASLPCVSVTGILPALCVCVCWGREVCRNACMCVCACLSLCLCMCEYFSGVEAAFMSVPSVENGSVSEGQPLSLHWASHSVPKSQMPLSDAKSLLYVHETTTENILYLWDQMSDLLHTSMWTWT